MKLMLLSSVFIGITDCLRVSFPFFNSANPWTCEEDEATAEDDAVTFAGLILEGVLEGVLTADSKRGMSGSSSSEGESTHLFLASSWKVQRRYWVQGQLRPPQ